MAAFRSAIKYGYPIELDVQLTADGKVVVFHDDTLERMTGDPRNVKDVPMSEIRELRLSGSGQHVPSLNEVLAAVKGSVPILVEVKNRGEVGPLEDAVAAQLLRYKGDVVVMSFNPFSLARIAEKAPGIPRGQLSGTFKDEDLGAHERFALRHLLMNWKSRPSFVAYEVDALPSLGTWLQRKRGRPLLAWTVKDQETAGRALSIADNIICDPKGLR